MLARRGLLLSLWLKSCVFLTLVASTWTARVRVPKLAQPDYSVYHTKDGVFKAFKSTVSQCSSFMKITKYNEGNAEYSTDVSVVTVEPGGLSEDQSSKIRVLLDFGEHGRELVSPEIALRLLSVLCSGGDELAALAGRAGVELGELQRVLNHTVLEVVPMENVHGREKVEGGALCERKNGRGVDPNRNWGVHWGHKEPDYDPAEEFPGTAPFSEPEALVMRHLAESLRPHVWLNVHSGMEALFMPYDHQARVPDGASANATLSLLGQLNTRVCGGRCAVGSGGKSVGYLAHGTATDYMYEELQVPISMTWEVYGDMNASYHDCFRMFNPLTREALQSTVDTWAAGILALLALLPDHPAIPSLGELSRNHSGTNASRQVQQAGAEEGEGGRAAAAGAAQEGAAGLAGAAQQQQQQLDVQGADGSSTGTGGNGSRQQAKAEEIAAAMRGQGNAGEQPLLAEGAGDGPGTSTGRHRGGWGAAGTGKGSLASLQQGWRHQRAHIPGTRADWEAVGLLLGAVAAIVSGYLLYTKPQVRYTLSQWGLVTRRSDIPL
ncbi:hypothetical protein N2152v2_005343 [Parachlorella kessleri]